MTEKKINQFISHQLVKAREAAKITQKRVAEKGIISQSELSKIENGVKNISAAKLCLLAKLYNQPLDFFFKT